MSDVSTDVSIVPDETETKIERLKATLFEFSFVGTMTFLPLFLSLIYYILPGKLGPVEAWISLVRHGELILYSCSILAPIAYNILQKDKSSGTTAITFVLISTCYFFYAVRFEAVEDSLIPVSYVLVLLTLGMWFFSIWERTRPSIPNVDSEVFAEQFNEMLRRGSDDE